MPRSLASFVAGFKAAAARRINLLRRSPGRPLWQRNYYEHVIRNREDLDEIRRYITDNPAQWAFDHENPACPPAPRERHHMPGCEERP